MRKRIRTNSVKVVIEQVAQEQQDKYSRQNKLFGEAVKSIMNELHISWEEAKIEYRKRRCASSIKREFKVLINYIIKPENRSKFLPLLMPLVRTTKKGHFVKFYTEQAIQKVVKLKMSKDMDYLTAFNALNAKKLIEA